MTLMPFTKAIELAHSLNMDPEDNWVYVAVGVDSLDNPSLGYVNVYDEDDNLLGPLGE